MSTRLPHSFVEQVFTDGLYTKHALYLKNELVC